MSDFPNNKLFTIQVNPTRKKAFYLHVGILVGLYLLTTAGQEPIKEYFKSVRESREIDQIRPLMKTLAESGKPDAIVWMIKHEYEAAKESGFAALTDAALGGDSESMWLYGVMQMDKGHPEVAKVWIEKAAKEGFPQAVAYMQSETQDD
ncbi:MULTISPECIES: hypothetical protein [Ectopseudomonas]|uniref:Catalytic LigB subunit of aromatic ring-opening dioxygenase n=2 Tax=Ectopseudomonas TaxID=3236654 RepID=A0A1G6PUF2_9GAMM|nr:MULTISPECIES: hypothetical protein [Pseudomonas]ALN21896.1 hypothetical protein DW68_024775 [Pseudomonas mendocina S5.2]KER98050.1 hypothetical protein HN51_24925 [Pseudomonas mendocina]MBP3061934.1 hypothetical protein [Pseudomonas chengduensis]NNB75226.1 hypothetical protein [Pseudomonas chengduensis]SDC83753.1 Catalytic LigB subunit of aromatic ring-opening dioxygenase [Pseudomonas chengduensis]